MSLWLTTTSDTAPRWWRTRYPFHVTRYPLDAVPASCQTTCPAGDWCYLVLTRLTSTATVHGIWELALTETHRVGMQCGGHHGDPSLSSLAYILAHALEHLTVVDLVSRHCVRRSLETPVGVFWPMATTLGFQPPSLRYALFYVRRGLAIHDAEEQLSARRAVMQVYQHLGRRIGLHDALFTPRFEGSPCACG